ncbi:MAG TPA: hypothetical protein VIU93_15765 [Gallionellaceae bacterium]
MSKSLVDALGDGAWSVSAVMFDLNDMVDDEGRPISERRADPAVRAGVEMEMRQCPYHDARHGKWMNASALAQVTQYYTPVLEELAAFRRQVNGADASWSDILAGVIDQLARPAIYLLQQRSERGPVPAQMAVGHKLAAGMFGVLRSLHERHAVGVNVPVSGASFMQLVDETGALVGASEVCAGSLKMIDKVSIALVEGKSDSQVGIDRTRVDIARCLALQVQMGIFWELYDRVHLWSLLRGEHRQRLRPFNDFLVRKLDQDAAALAALAPARPDGARLPAALDAQARIRLADALRDEAAAHVQEEDVRAATALLNEPGSAIRYDAEVAPFAQRVARYLGTHRLFVDELSRLELELRSYLGFAADAPIRLGGAVFPMPQALPWYELILGRRIGTHSHLTGSSTGLRVASPA